MEKTLRQSIESTPDRQRRGELNRALRTMNHHANRDLGDAIVQSRTAMGTSLGRCLLNTGEIHLSDALLQEGMEQQLVATGVHEEEHANNNHYEGLAERRGMDVAGLDEPTEKLRKQVDAADEMIEILGEDQTYKLARQGGKADVLLEQALVMKMIGGLLHWTTRQFRPKEAEAREAQARQKARKLVARAKDYEKKAA